MKDLQELQELGAICPYPSRSLDQFRVIFERQGPNFLHRGTPREGGRDPAPSPTRLPKLILVRFFLIHLLKRLHHPHPHFLHFC